MPADRPMPLATAQQMEQSPLRDVVAGLDADELRDVMLRATRAVESFCRRRFAPFRGLVESHRAEAAGPDELVELGGSAFSDVGLAASAGYGTALGNLTGSLVRRCWVRERPPLYSDLWTYSDVSVEVHRSTGGIAAVPGQNLIGEIEPDTGMLWFRLGTFIPAGSRIRVTYSGGYSTVPADLVQACRLLAAADVVDEDSFPGAAPAANSHGGQGSGDGGFTARAHKLLEPWVRSA